MALMLLHANATVTAGFETDSPFYKSRNDVRLALRYLIGTYTAKPGYLRIDGRPVIFFWRLRAIPLDGASNPLEAWRAVRDDVDPNHQAIWIAEGDRFEYLEPVRIGDEMGAIAFEISVVARGNQRARYKLRRPAARKKVG